MAAAAAEERRPRAESGAEEIDTVAIEAAIDGQGLVRFQARSTDLLH